MSDNDSDLTNKRPTRRNTTTTTTSSKPPTGKPPTIPRFTTRSSSAKFSSLFNDSTNDDDDGHSSTTTTANSSSLSNRTKSNRLKRKLVEKQWSTAALTLNGGGSSGRNSAGGGGLPLKGALANSYYRAMARNDKWKHKCHYCMVKDLECNGQTPCNQCVRLVQNSPNEYPPELLFLMRKIRPENDGDDGNAGTRNDTIGGDAHGENGGHEKSGDKRHDSSQSSNDDNSSSQTDSSTAVRRKSRSGSGNSGRSGGSRASNGSDDDDDDEYSRALKNNRNMTSEEKRKRRLELIAQERERPPTAEILCVPYRVRRDFAFDHCVNMYNGALFKDLPDLMSRIIEQESIIDRQRFEMRENDEISDRGYHLKMIRLEKLNQKKRLNRQSSSTSSRSRTS